MLKRYLGALLAVMLLAFAISCGGGGTTAQPGPGGGDDTPGIVDNIDNPPAASDYPQAQAPQGIWPDAPLGTDPAYNVQPVSGRQVSHTASAKGGSALAPGTPFMILNSTIAPSDVAEGDLDWGATDLRFEEGTEVTFWMQYEVAPNTAYNVWWKVFDTANDGATLINTAEGPFSDSQGGVFVRSMTLTLPYVEGADNIAALFEGWLAVPQQQVSSLVVVDGTTVIGQVPFLIEKVAVTMIEYSPEEAQMGWEDLIVNSDYDYNDLVTRMRVAERRRVSDGKLVQISLYVKANARGAGYNHGWQFNIDGAFPGTTAMAYVQQYYNSGATHGAQRIWTSQDGASIPVFTSSKEALPAPPESYATNTVKGSTFIYGDYAEVTILFDTPLTPGSYTPMPYKPKLKVYANDGGVYTIGLWTRRGDPVDSNGRPLAFIIPDNYAWPMEGRKIWIGYPRFNDWVIWVNDLTKSEESQPMFWNDTPVWKTDTTYNVFQRSLFH